MDIMTAIMTRRSIRKYNGIKILPEQLDTILRAGFQGPSAHNLRPISFVVINDRDQLVRIEEAHRYAKMLVQAGCGIVVCGDTTRQEHTGFLVEDCSAAIENMLLTAQGLELGAVWCGIYPVPELVESFQSILKLPGTIIPVGLVVVGNKAKDEKPFNRYDESKIHKNVW